jgi:hypothetical protein
MKDGVKIFEGVKAGVVAKRALAAKFIEIHVTFEDNLARRWNLKVNGFAFH